MSEAEKATYETLLLKLKDCDDKYADFWLHKLERFVAVINIRLNQAIPDGWELP